MPQIIAFSNVGSQYNIEKDIALYVKHCETPLWIYQLIKKYFRYFLKLVLQKISFDPVKFELEKESRISLQTIGAMTKKNSKITLHILAYQKNNKTLARKKAITIRTYLLDMFPRIKPEQIKLSWFGVPERISTGKVNHTLDDSINLFAVLK